MSKKEEILVTLYYYYPKRLTVKKFMKILKYDNLQYLNRVLNDLEIARFIHITEEEAKLTRLGIKFAEEKILVRP